MTEYITKEQAKELIRNHILGCAMLPSPEYTLDDLFHDMCWDLNHIPSADVVEVVRCKDCKHMRTISGEGWGIDTDLYYCGENEILVSPVGYCSDGKRKDGGNNNEKDVLAGDYRIRKIRHKAKVSNIPLH